MSWLLSVITLELVLVYPDVPQLSIKQLLKKTAGDRAPILLDARSYEEYAVSHLPQAQWAGPDLDLHSITSTDHLIVVYCSVGVRSTRLARDLRQQGFNAVNLEGSIFRWAIDGLPLAGPGADQALVHPYNACWGKILPARHRASDDMIAALWSESQRSAMD